MDVFTLYVFFCGPPLLVLGQACTKYLCNVKFYKLSDHYQQYTPNRDSAHYLFKKHSYDIQW